MSKFIRVSEFVLILLLPFIVFYWMTPILGDLSIGNDYVTFSIDHQLALQYSLKKGTFPLFAPGFAGGHSSAALTLGQMYHPISHLAAHLPGYWDGDALTVNTVLRLVGIGITHLLIFILLVQLKLKDAIAFAVSFITVYNLRMLDMFRYGASLENYLGFVLVVGAMGLYFLKPTRVIGPALIVVATYLLVTGGHPQIMYFGLLGAGLSGLLIPFSFPAITGDPLPSRAEFGRYIAVMATCLFAGILLASSYTVPFYFEFIKENSARVAKDYQWSLAYSDSWSGVLNGFFRPLHSNVHGAFGSSAIILFAALSPLIGAFQKRVPKMVYVLSGAFLLVFLISLGKATPLHFAFWKLFPLANSFRTPGRINMILPVVFMLSLAWLFNKSSDASASGRLPLPSVITPGFLLSLVAILVYVIYNVFLIHKLPSPTHHHPAVINEHTHDITLIAYWTGLAALILLSLYLLAKRFRPFIGILLAIAVMVQTGVELRWGTWIINRYKKPTEAQIDSKMHRQLKVLGLAGFGMEPPAISDQIARSALDPSMAVFYRTFHTVKNNDAAYAYIAKHRKSTEAVVVTEKEPKHAAQCPNKDKACKPDTLELTESSYNSVRFNVDATESGLLAVGFPYFPRFEADIDGAWAPIFRTNGYQLGVFVPKGRHKVTIRATSPATRTGIIISLVTFLTIIFVFSRHIRRRPFRYVAIALSALFAIGMFYFWNSKLYGGENLKTVYKWRSSSFSPEDNLAFGRKASMSGIRSIERPYDYYAGRGVDGDRNGTGFTSGPNKRKPWWQVDLGLSQQVEKIVIYNGYGLSKHRPVLIQTSNDGIQFDTVKTLPSPAGGKALEVRLDNAKTRYIRLKSSGEGAISLKEIEVYGPSES